jgi:hypothetical protein
VDYYWVLNQWIKPVYTYLQLKYSFHYFLCWEELNNSQLSTTVFGLTLSRLTSC